MGAEASRLLDSTQSPTNNSPNSTDNSPSITVSASSSSTIIGSTSHTLLDEVPREVSRIEESIRMKINYGIQYNLKVIIKGERGTGKTNLWKRFQGQIFREAYKPTNEIQSATINWNYRDRKDNIKVEVWDIVDKAYKESKDDDREFHYSNTEYGRHNIQLLDATVIDVYKSTNSVIFMINPFNSSSLDYVKKNYSLVPLTTSILILYNFRDLIESRGSKVQVTINDISTLCDEIIQERIKRNDASPSLSSSLNFLDVHYVQTSLKNCFGLDQVHKYLEIPFLRLKMKSLQEQIKTTEDDLRKTQKELNITINTASYTHFLEKNNLIPSSSSTSSNSIKYSKNNENILQDEETKIEKKDIKNLSSSSSPSLSSTTSSKSLSPQNNKINSKKNMSRFRSESSDNEVQFFLPSNFSIHSDRKLSSLSDSEEEDLVNGKNNRIKNDKINLIRNKNKFYEENSEEDEEEEIYNKRKNYKILEEKEEEEIIEKAKEEATEEEELDEDEQKFLDVSRRFFQMSSDNFYQLSDDENEDVNIRPKEIKETRNDIQKDRGNEIEIGREELESVKEIRNIRENEDEINLINNIYSTNNDNISDQNNQINSLSIIKKKKKKSFDKKKIKVDKDDDDDEEFLYYNTEKNQNNSKNGRLDTDAIEFKQLKYVKTKKILEL